MKEYDSLRHRVLCQCMSDTHTIRRFVTCGLECAKLVARVPCRVGSAPFVSVSCYPTFTTNRRRSSVTSYTVRDGVLQQKKEQRLFTSDTQHSQTSHTGAVVDGYGTPPHSHQLLHVFGVT